MKNMLFQVFWRKNMHFWRKLMHFDEKFCFSSKQICIFDEKWCIFDNKWYIFSGNVNPDFHSANLIPKSGPIYIGEVRRIITRNMIYIGGFFYRKCGFHENIYQNIPSSHSVDKKCGNTTNWGTSLVSLKSGWKSTFIYANNMAEFGLNSKLHHSIHQKCTVLHRFSLKSGCHLFFFAILTAW